MLPLLALLELIFFGYCCVDQQNSMVCFYLFDNCNNVKKPSNIRRLSSFFLGVSMICCSWLVICRSMSSEKGNWRLNQWVLLLLIFKMLLLVVIRLISPLLHSMEDNIVSWWFRYVIIFCKMWNLMCVVEQFVMQYEFCVSLRVEI